MCVSNASSHPKLVVICRGCLFLRAESAAQAAGAMGGSQQPMARSYTCLDACMPLSYTYIYIYIIHMDRYSCSPGPARCSPQQEIKSINKFDMVETTRYCIFLLVQFSECQIHHVGL